MKIECPYCKDKIKTNKIISHCEKCGALCVDGTKIILMVLVSISFLYIIKKILTLVL